MRRSLGDRYLGGSKALHRLDPPGKVSNVRNAQTQDRPGDIPTFKRQVEKELPVKSNC